VLAVECDVLPKNITIASVEDELPALFAFGQRYGWAIKWIPDSLVLLADGKHPADDSPARIHGDVSSYRALPPAWRFIVVDGDTTDKVRAVKSGCLPGGISSMFHDNGVICAPFNRLAYQEHGGPHSDWNGPPRWLEVKGKVSATTLAEMLAQILLHLNYSLGWKI
jgi:hypothetical protein